MTEIKYLLYGFVGLMFFILTGLFLVGSLGTTGEFAKDADYVAFNKSFNRVQEFESGVGSLKASVNSQNTSSTIGDIGLISSLISQSWNSLKLLFTGFDFVTAIFQVSGTMFHIPVFVVTLATLVITLTIVFGILYLIFNQGGPG